MKPFEVIAGDSLGGVSPREMCADIIARGIEQGIEADHELWIELARTADEDIDVDGWTEWLVEITEGRMPPYCALTWRDNELTVVPCVESALEDCPRGDELPDTNTCASEFFCVVSDHGNVTLYRASDSDGTPNSNGAYWRRVWAVV